MSKKIIVGIDEVGRGPLAGPVSVGVVAAPWRFLKRPELGDSTLLARAARARVYALARTERLCGNLTYTVVSISAAAIDRRGISWALRTAVARGLAKLDVPADALVLLDGGLTAPADYRQQRSIIRGDVLEPLISLASIVAKVERDRYMSGVAQHRYPEYDFASHKGYGTAAHIALIRAHGPSPLHRRSFLKNFVV